MPAKHLIHNKRQRPLSRLDSRASSLGRADRVLLLDEVMNMVRGATLQLLCFAKFMLPGSNSSSTAADHMAAPLRVPLLIGVCIDRRKPRGWSTLNGRCRAADSRAQRPFLCPARTQREWPSSRRRPNGGFMLFAGGAPPGRPRRHTPVPGWRESCWPLYRTGMQESAFLNPAVLPSCRTQPHTLSPLTARYANKVERSYRCFPCADTVAY
jgi:hypothetical protein